MAVGEDMRIVFMGTGEISLPSLGWLFDATGIEVIGVFTQPDKPVGRRQVMTPPTVKVLARERDIPVFQPVSLRKEPDAVEALRQLRADLFVVMAYGQILPESVISAPKLACVNLHASLLPRHRGASPIQAAIREGDAESGITLMHVVPRLDAGDMIRKETLKLGPEDTGGILHDRLADLGPTILEVGLPALFRGEAEAVPQEERQATYAGKLTREDALIDWHQPAERIERIIRAYDPWPGTWTRLRDGKQDRKLKIFPYGEVESCSGGEPGTVLESGGDLLVACGGDTAIRLKGDMQFEGKKRLPMGDFLKGRSVGEGAKLG